MSLPVLELLGAPQEWNRDSSQATPQSTGAPEGGSLPSSRLSDQGTASVTFYPYATRIRSLLEEGRISEAQALLAIAGPLVPLDSKLREVLAPPRIRAVDRRDTDRSSDFEWLRANGAQYRGQWVALEGGQLVAAAPSLKELREQLSGLPDTARPLIHRID